MTVKQQIEKKITDKCQPVHLEVINESPMHNVPEGAESHFKVVVVSKDFSGKTLVNRHRLIYDILAEELAGSIHALTIHTYTPQEWEKQGQGALQSPKCHGGGR